MILCQKCSDVEVKRVGELCLGCEAEERKKPNVKRSLITIWECPSCQTEREGIPGGRCGKCGTGLREKQLKPTPLCPKCSTAVEVEGILCKACYNAEFEKNFPKKEEVKLNHVHLIGISEKLMQKITAHERGMQEISKMTESIQSLAAEILDELQKAMKDGEKL